MLREWRGRLVDSGWACPSWPTAWCGLGLPPWAEDIAHEEIAAAGAVGTPFGVGFGLAAPTVLAHGSDHLKERLLRPTLTGEVTWCQLFSEPGSGSDLAGLTTRADRDGDEWVLNGQKVWSTSAHHADWGLLLARTDWDTPKHRGITCFALPMRQPGVDVRALRQMNGHASFNEVFLTDARAPGANVIGDPNEGWRVALTTLAHERQFRTVAAPRGDQAKGRAAREARAEADEYFRTYRWYPQRAGRPDLAVEIARADGLAADPFGRQAVAGLYTLQRAHGWTMQRAHAARAGSGAGPRRFARQACGECRRARLGPCPFASRGRGWDARRRRHASRRRDRRSPRVGSRAVDCRWHRRDPAQHHRGAGPRLAEGTVGRPGPAVPRTAPELSKRKALALWLRSSPNTTPRSRPASKEQPTRPGASAGSSGSATPRWARGDYGPRSTCATN